MSRIVSTEFTTGTVAGTRWYHTVQVDTHTVQVVVRPNGCGYSMEACAATEDLAAQAIAIVAQTPKGR